VKSVIDRLTAVVDECQPGDSFYLETDIRAVAPIVIPLLPYTPPSVIGPYREQPPRGLLAAIEEGIDVEFAVFELERGPATDARSGQIVEPARYSSLFSGCGPSGALRELRHTYWGESDNSGYIHMPNAKLIAAAFAALKRWFDCG
jgi:hypothetical protein